MSKKPYGLKCINPKGDFSYTIGKIYPWDYDEYCIYDDNNKRICCIGYDPYNFIERSHYIWEIVEEAPTV